MDIGMNPQVVGRYQRARGLNLKRILQFAALLAICLWLLYQIKHPYDKSSTSYFSKQRSILRRKVSIGWLAHRNESDLEREKIIGESKTWERDAGDDPFGKSVEKANKYLNEIIVLADEKNNQRNHGIRSDGDGVATQNKERRKKDSVNEGYRDGKRREIDVEIYSKAMNRRDVTSEQDLTLEDKDADRITDNSWQHGSEDGVSGSGFDDENGVPLGLNDVTESNDDNE